MGTSSYTYDAAMRTTALVHKDGSGNALASYLYGYDPGNRLTSETVNGSNVTYGYDKDNQVTSAGTLAYGYDANGNRNTGSYSPGTGNRLTTDGTWTYTYDNEGNVTRKSKGPSAETWDYGYDNRNQMVTAQQRSAPNGTLLASVTYAYDVNGERVEQDTWTQASGTTVVVRFALDGHNAYADLDGSNNLVMRRLYLDGMNQPFARIDSGGTAAWYLQDRQGSVRDVVVQAGTSVLDHVSYDPFGQVLSETSAAQGDRYKYDGGQYDATTGNELFLWRWYDPATGRWFSQDPIEFRGGDANLYRYVGNGPTDGLDTSGLARLKGAPPPQRTWLEAAGNFAYHVGNGFVQAPVQVGLIVWDWGNAVVTDGSVILHNVAGTPVYYPELQSNLFRGGERASQQGGDTALYWYAAGASFNSLTLGIPNMARAAYKGDWDNFAEGCGNLLFVVASMGAVDYVVGVPADPVPTPPGAFPAEIPGLAPGVTEPGGLPAGVADDVVGNPARQGPKSCFPAGTPVHTADGLKPVERVAVGDRVLAYDHRRLCWAMREVVEVYQLTHQGTMATLQVKGETLRATGGHPFWVVRGERLAGRPSPVRISAYEAGSEQEGGGCWPGICGRGTRCYFGMGRWWRWRRYG